MKKIVITAVTAFIAVPAMAAPGDTATDQGTATAEIVAPITLTHDAGSALDFGTITPGVGAAGSVTVTPAGAATAGGDATLVGGTPTADSFSVTGDPSRTFDIVTLGGTVTSGANSMTFTTTPSGANGALDGSGNASFTVGGTLTVGDSQPAGSYAGTYDATVTYN